LKQVPKKMILIGVQSDLDSDSFNLKSGDILRDVGYLVSVQTPFALMMHFGPNGIGPLSFGVFSPTGQPWGSLGPWQLSLFAALILLCKLISTPEQ
jgi:hypothetical protein